MPNWKKLITSGSDAALNSLNVTSALTASGLNYPTSDGTDGQVLLTDGSGVLSFSDNITYVTVKNVSSGTLTKGTPVHSTGTSGNAPEVIAASASVATSMPAGFVLAEDIAATAEGRAVLSGFLNGVDTNGLTEGANVYVGSSGGYTTTKPTSDSNLIQNIAIIGKSDANGSLYIIGAGRSNDVPNLPTGKIWVGSDNYTVTSSLIDLDETGGTINLNGDITGSGKVLLDQYGSGTISGTTAYNLAVDSSGNIIENSANTRSVFVATSTDTTTNINATTTIQWNSEDIKDSGYTHSSGTNPDQITITQAGTYKIYAAITYTTTVERANVALQILVNDVATGARGAGGYVRSASGHNDGTTIVEDYVTVNANDVIKIQTSREAVSGTVTLKSGESKIIIEKLTGLTLSTTDANTLGGLGAADFVAVTGDTMTGALTISTDTNPGLVIKNTAQNGEDQLLVVRGARNAPNTGVKPAAIQLQVYDFDPGVNRTGAEFYMEATDETGGDLTDFEVGIRYRKDGALIDGFKIHDGEADINGNLTVSGNISGSGKLFLDIVDNASSDTDKFLVLNGNEIEYRSGSQLLSDIGAGTGNGDITSVSGSGNVSGITLSGDHTTGDACLTLGGTFSTTTSSITNFNTGVGTIVDGCGFTTCQGTVTGAAGSDSQVQYNSSGNFAGSSNLTFDGTNLTVGGRVTATEIVTNVVSQSISFATGSNRFGDEISDTHTFTGSLNVTGSLNLTSVINAGTDTDKFLVLDSSNNVDFRTGAEVRSDIGAGTGNGDITSVSGSGNVSGITLSGCHTSGDACLTLGGTFATTTSSITNFNTGVGTIVDGCGFTTCTGDITGVTAGSGLTGGATSGNATLNIGAGTGIDVAADSIAVDVSDFMSNGSNNRIITATGTDAMNAEANLTFDGTTLTVSGSGSTILDIQGSQGQLFSVTDDLTGTLFTVSDISGIPIFEVDASGESLFDGNVEVQGDISASGLTTTNTLTVTGLANQASEATALMISSSNVVGTRELGSNAFNSTAFSTCQGTVTSVTSGNTNTITIGGTAAAPTVEANTAAVANAGTNLATGDQIYDHVTTRINGLTSCTGTVTGTGVNNQVMTSTEGTGIQGEANLTFDGSTLTVTGGITGSTTLTIGSSQTNTGTLSSIVGGFENLNEGNYSSILGGSCHCIHTICSGAFILGGTGNEVSGSTYGAILGGGGNIVKDADGGFIGVGISNCVTADHSSIVGGTLNTASAACSFIGGGRSNTISGYYAGDNIIAGGASNTISTSYGSSNTIAGGASNTIRLDNTAASTIGGGCKNEIVSCASTIAGGILNTGSGACSFIGGGESNYVCGPHSALVGGNNNENLDPGNSFLGGGLNNSINSGNSRNVLVGGQLNCITGLNALGTIVGGCANYVGGTSGDCFQFIGGGANNKIPSRYSSIVGGTFNTASGACSFIGGGCGNLACNFLDFVGGGKCNRTMAQYGYNSIVGGRDNTISYTGNDDSEPYAFIGGGCGNSVSGYAGGNGSAIVAGIGNAANGDHYQFIGGGFSNTVTNSYSTLVGGAANLVTGNAGFIGAGRDNKVTSTYSSIVGGTLNTASAACSFIGGGQSNKLCGGQSGRSHDFIGGGCGNTVSTYYGCNVIVGGKGNSMSGYYSFNFIGTGCLHTIANGGYNTIVGGGRNGISSTGPYSNNNFIGGGFCNNLNTNGGGCAAIVSGLYNSISNSYSGYGAEHSSFIGAGCRNIISTYSNSPSFSQGYNIIVGGRGNGLKCVTGGSTCIGCSVIVGGYLNTGSNAFTFIGGGCKNIVTGCTSTIVGGTLNTGSDACSFIGGGESNVISGSDGYTTIVGGCANCICSICDGIGGSTSIAGSNIVGGFNNYIFAPYSSIVGGVSNTISSDYINGYFSNIVGGCSNTVRGNFNTITGGSSNCITSFSCNNAIVGGCANTASGDFHFIGGGKNNRILNSLSSGSGILGGINNTIENNGSFIVGSDLTSTANCTTFMNNACIEGTTTTQTLVETSARRFKECILPLQDQIENIKKLEPVEFQWKKEKTKDIGFIAEDVLKIYPDLIAYEEDGEINGIQYSKLTTVLVKALQQQQEQIDELKNEIFILKSNN